MSEEDWLTEYTRFLIREHWRPHGLDKLLLKQLLKLREEEERCGHKWMARRLEYSVETATNQAKGLSKKYGKPENHYLNMALRNRWIENWYRAIGF